MMQRSRKPRFLAAADAHRQVCDLWRDGVHANPAGLSAAQIGDAMGVSLSMVYRYAEDECPTLQRLVAGIVFLAREGRDARLLQRMVEEAGYRLALRPAAEGTPGGLCGATGLVLRDVGNLAATVAAAMADGELSDEECAVIDREVEDAARALEELRCRVRRNADVKEVG